MSWHEPIPDAGLVVDMIKRELERDTNWDTVDIRVEMFEEADGFDSTEAKTPFEIFTKLLGVNKDHPKWKTIKGRYYQSRTEMVRDMTNEGMTQQEIAESMGISQPMVSKIITLDKNGYTPQERTQVNLSNYTKPETAAGKLVDKFGHEWCRDLVNALKEQLSG